MFDETSDANGRFILKIICGKCSPTKRESFFGKNHRIGLNQHRNCHTICYLLYSTVQWDN